MFVGQDIIFHTELDELQKRLKNFRYHVLLSQPNPEWPGARGHINRGFVCTAVPEIKDQVFFLCGPPQFMGAARTILMELGVEPERIRQETFGGADAVPKPSLPRSAEGRFIVEFARSGKTGAVLEGQTLLEAAAEAGVEIPSAMIRYHDPGRSCLERGLDVSGMQDPLEQHRHRRRRANPFQIAPRQRMLHGLA